MNNGLLSEVEELVLLGVGISTADSYGFAVKEAINIEAGRTLGLATVHAALYRLEKKGYLRSSLGGATQTRGGRRKRLFSITNAGVQVLRARADVRTRMWGAVKELQPSGGGAR